MMKHNMYEVIVSFSQLKENANGLTLLILNSTFYFVDTMYDKNDLNGECTYSMCVIALYAVK